MKSKECGGVQKFRCKVYGNNGEITPPSLDEFSYQLRMSTWNEKQRNRNCGWYPFCTSKMVVCGGSWRQNCSKYGKNGSRCKEAPSEEILVKARKKNKAMMRTATRHIKGRHLN